MHRKKDCFDQSILDALKKGNNPEAIKCLYEDEIYQPIRKMILNNSGKEEDVEDLFQEVVTALYTRIHKEDFLLNAKLSTYLFSVANNLWLKELRKRKNRGPKASEETLKIVAIEEDYGFSEPNERQQKLKNCLSKLTEKKRKLIMGFYFERRNLEDLAEELGYSSRNTAKEIICRARKDLKNCIEH